MGVALTEQILADLRSRAHGAHPRDETSGSRQFQPPLCAAALDTVEQVLGFELPHVLRQLYGEVANGGFGPGYGLIGLRGGDPSDMKRDVVGEYHVFRQPDHNDPGRSWPDRLLPICHWGCAIYSCVDCSTPTGAVIRFDPNPVADDWTIAWQAERGTLAGWLQSWLDGPIP